jgi:hypothetical protein
MNSRGRLAAGGLSGNFFPITGKFTGKPRFMSGKNGIARRAKEAVVDISCVFCPPKLTGSDFPRNRENPSNNREIQAE